MHCIVMSSPRGRRAWNIHRSIELLAYHRGERIVRILFVLLAENKLADGANILRIMHRGSVRCTLAEPWPLPCHPDEETSRSIGILEQLYGKAFEESGGHILYKNALSPCDTWHQDSEPREVLLWPRCEHSATDGDGSGHIEVERPQTDFARYVPFTTWSCGPFSEEKLYLISFHLEFAGETYDTLVEREPTFSVDGPERLLSRIRYDDLANVPAKHREGWVSRWADFDAPATRVPSDSYDVLIMEPPLADQVTINDECCTTGIYQAPMQPGDSAVRFVTTDDFFTLPMSYAHEHTESKKSSHAATG